MNRLRRGISVHNKFKTVKYWRVYAPNGADDRGYCLGVVRALDEPRAHQVAYKLAYELNVYGELFVEETNANMDSFGV